jgi:hypothetical protein
MTFRQYLLAIFKKALLTPWHLSETVATGVGIIGALLTWLLPKITPYIQIAYWAIPLALLIPLTLYRLILAPYWLIKEEKLTSAKYEQKLAEFEQTSPNIIIDSIRQAQLFRTSQVVDGKRPTYEPVQVWFKNRPQVSNEHSIALHVSAQIDFACEDGSAFTLRVFGQWAINNPPNFVGSAQLSPTVDIPPGSLPVKLNVALKHINDSSAYAYSQEALTRDPDGRDSPSEIPPGKYKVNILLQGIGIDRTYTFELINAGVGKTLVLNVV